MMERRAAFGQPLLPNRGENMLREMTLLNIPNVSVLFYVLLTLSSAVFLFLWFLRMVTLFRRRDKLKGKHRLTTVIWMLTPVVIIIGLGLLGPQLVHNLQHLP